MQILDAQWWGSDVRETHARELRGVGAEPARRVTAAGAPANKAAVTAGGTEGRRD